LDLDFVPQFITHFVDRSDFRFLGFDVNEGGKANNLLAREAQGL
jgi:hypothetical protein